MSFKRNRNYFYDSDEEDIDFVKKFKNNNTNDDSLDSDSEIPVATKYFSINDHYIINKLTESFSNLTINDFRLNQDSKKSQDIDIDKTTTFQVININKLEKDNKIDHANSPVNKLNNFGSTIVQSSFYTNTDIVELTCDDLYALHDFDIEIDLSALQNFLSQPLSLVPVEAR